MAKENKTEFNNKIYILKATGKNKAHHVFLMNSLAFEKFNSIADVKTYTEYNEAYFDYGIAKTFNYAKNINIVIFNDTNELIEYFHHYNHNSNDESYIARRQELTDEERKQRNKIRQHEYYLGNRHKLIRHK